MFSSFRWVRVVSLRQNEFRTVTELAASAIALMLTIELGVAIACAAAFFAPRQAGESDPPDRHNRGGTGRPPV